MSLIIPPCINNNIKDKIEKKEFFFHSAKNKQRPFTYYFL